MFVGYIGCLFTDDFGLRTDCCLFIYLLLVLPVCSDLFWLFLVYFGFAVMLCLCVAVSIALVIGVIGV